MGGEEADTVKPFNLAEQKSANFHVFYSGESKLHYSDTEVISNHQQTISTPSNSLQAPKTSIAE